MDWLSEALRETVKDSEDLTPFERRFRQRFLSELDDDRLSDARETLRGIAKSDATLRDDAEKVLGLLDEDDETLDHVIDELDALVKVSRSRGGVTLSEVGGDAFWRGILLSQIRHKLERKAQKAGVDAAEYREWLQQGDEALRARTEGVDREGERTFAEDFGNPG